MWLETPSNSFYKSKGRSLEINGVLYICSLVYYMQSKVDILSVNNFSFKEKTDVGDLCPSA